MTDQMDYTDRQIAMALVTPIECRETIIPKHDYGEDASGTMPHQWKERPIS